MTSTSATLRPGPLDALGTSIFAEMSALAVKTGSINLGQGFPDTDGPARVLQAAADAIMQGHGNQYPPGAGIPQLRSAVAEHQRQFYGLTPDPEDEVLITVGATEGVASALLSLARAGDEVVLFEPYFDSYAACIELSGAARRAVMLRPDAGRWTFDPDELRNAVTSRTRLILMNSPHNPTGTVFTEAELRLIAEIACEHDLIVIADEVYEHLVFDGRHIPIATFPGMAERTVSISSAGKTFGVTGWKVGWATGAAALISQVRSVKQFLTYVGSGPFQYAIAEALSASTPEFYAELAGGLDLQRAILVDGLRELGFTVHSPQGSYFATVELDGHAQQWCRELPERAGVVAIPSRVFYDSDVDSYVRFAFCKRPDVLREALQRLRVVAPGHGAK
jgi:N-succinyldiaminopimelate aminotransferase